MLGDAFSKRLEIERLERPSFLKFEARMADLELIVDKEDVGFGATESSVERIQQRSLVEIVVVSMSRWIEIVRRGCRQNPEARGGDYREKSNAGDGLSQVFKGRMQCRVGSHRI